MNRSPSDTFPPAHAELRQNSAVRLPQSRQWGWASPELSFSRTAGRAGEQPSRVRSDRGGNSLGKATSARPYLQGLMVPGTARSLRDSTSRTDPDFYRLFDKDSPNTFQADGLLISCELCNLSSAPISIALLNRQGKTLQGSQTTVAPGTAFIYSNSLSKNTFYIKVFTAASGPNRYVINLPIINS
ncbi:MAG: hypothetical protein ACKO7W_07450 [Elainella sp.]